jgi:hypothetical protein
MGRRIVGAIIQFHQDSCTVVLGWSNLIESLTEVFYQGSVHPYPGLAAAFRHCRRCLSKFPTIILRGSSNLVFQKSYNVREARLYCLLRTDLEKQLLIAADSTLSRSQVPIAGSYITLCQPTRVILTFNITHPPGASLLIDL